MMSTTDRNRHPSKAGLASASIARRVAIVIVLSAPAIATAQDESDAIHSVVKGIIEADMAGDITRILGYYADDAVLIAPDGPNIVGKSDIQSHYQKLLSGRSFSIHNESLETIISGDWAITRGSNVVEVTERSTGVTSRATSKYLMTLHLENDADRGWKIAHLMWTSDDMVEGADPPCDANRLALCAKRQ